MRVLRGKPTSPGYARGTAVVYRKYYSTEVSKRKLAAEEVQQEMRRFHQALEISSNELNQLRLRVQRELGQSESQIFAVHIALLADRHFHNKIHDRISQQLINVEQAIVDELQTLEKLLSELNSEYLRERARDIRDVAMRLLKHLGNDNSTHRLADLQPDTIVVAEHLLPSDTIDMDRGHVIGIVTEHGTSSSHSAILARSLGIPAVAQAENCCAAVEDGDAVAIDGGSGLVTVGMDPGEIESFEKELSEYAIALSDIGPRVKSRCMTTDAVAVSLQGDICRANQAKELLQAGLEGAGLFRTEYLLCNSHHPPGIDQQQRTYSHVIELLSPEPVIIRTFDFSLHNKPAYLKTRFPAGARLRGLRYALSEGGLLRAQLRAIVRSAAGAPNVFVLFAMAADWTELGQASEILSQVAQQEGYPAPKIGAAIQTPSILFELEEVMDLVNFINIGSDELCRFMMVTEIEDCAESSMLYAGVLRAIQAVRLATEKVSMPLSIWGSAATNPATACLLVGLGLESLCVPPDNAQLIRMAIQRSNFTELRQLARQVLACETEQAAAELVNEHYGQIIDIP